MKQELMDAIQEMPVIAAVKDDAGLCNALTNENIRVVFVLYGDICNISSIVRRIHEAGRFAVVHVDLIAGLAGKEVAVDFIRTTTEADGIISTRQSFIRRAKELGLAAILRVFLLDSIALESLDKIPAHYFPDDDPTKQPVMKWRAHSTLIYTNWLNYFVYQTTPFDISEKI